MTILLAVMLMSSPWARHVIDDGSRGADGTKLADINGDGRVDIVTGWEEGGEIRVYLNPGLGKVRERWPRSVVGRVGSPEDAVFVDVDGDGRMEVVSSCEGETRAMYVHKAGKDGVWRTTELAGSKGMMQWMFAVPAQVDGRGEVDLIAGGKGEGAAIGWWEARGGGAFVWHEVRRAGWVMTLAARDMDGDGDVDILFSDRKGAATGAYWMENAGGVWREHEIGGRGREVMFLAATDFDGDGLEDVVGSMKEREIVVWQRLDKGGLKWAARRFEMPATTGRAKGVAAGDLDGDGLKEIVFSCESTPEGASGVMYLTQAGEARAVSGWPGIKYDLVELLDMDGDGDLDVLTSEERAGLGVVWFENPGRGR